MSSGCVTFGVAAYDGTVVITVNGEIDAASADEFNRIVEPWIDAPSLVFDCEHLDFIDSSGLRILLGVAAARAENNRCILRSPSTATCRILEITHTTSLFDTQGAETPD